MSKKIPRYYNLKHFIEPGKVLVIFGPRQAGKTTLLKSYLKTSKVRYKLDLGELLKTQRILSSQDIDILKRYTEGYRIIAVDEAHKIPNVGLNAKIIIDNISGIQLILTGSSSFDLLGQVGEPLVGRKITLLLYPVSQIEMSKIYNKFDLQNRLWEFLIYGCYPEVISATNYNKKTALLNELIEGYLLKDILQLENVKSSKTLVDLLTLLAFQLGNEVSFNELAQKLQIDVKTVARYLDLLEKSYVILALRGFSRNLRDEITSKKKYYFYDTGVRNAIISNFNDLEKRDDIGGLWENFLVMERIKKQKYKRIFSNNYFWRTWGGQEVDWVEEREGKLFGYEFKWGDRGSKKTKVPKNFIDTYHNAVFEVISRKNYLEFVL